MNTSLTQDITITFTFHKACAPGIFCGTYASNIGASLISFLVLLALFCGMGCWSVRYFKKRTEATPLGYDPDHIATETKVRQYSWTGFCILSFTAIGFFVLLFIPLFWWVPIPSLVMIVIYLYVIAKSERTGTIVWMVCSICHVIFSAIWLVVIVIIIVGSAIAQSNFDDGDNDAREQNQTNLIPSGAQSLLWFMNFYCLVFVAINICIACCLYTAIDRKRFLDQAGHLATGHGQDGVQMQQRNIQQQGVYVGEPVMLVAQPVMSGYGGPVPGYGESSDGMSAPLEGGALGQYRSSIDYPAGGHVVQGQFPVAEPV